MNRVAQAVKFGIMALALLAGSYGVWTAVSDRELSSGAFEISARFRDAAHLPEGSRVVIAGLPVGQIDRMALEGRYARVFMRIRDDIALYANAIAIKKYPSALGDFYIEIDPGTPFSINAAGERVSNPRLSNHGEIARVAEATTSDQIMQSIEETLPKANSFLLSVRDDAEDVSAQVNGPIGTMVARPDHPVHEKSEAIRDFLAGADDAVSRMDGFTKDIRATTSGADEKIQRKLDEIDEALDEATTFMTETRHEVEDTGTQVRQRLDGVDDVLNRSASVVTDVDESQGTFGRLVNDPTLADDLEDMTDGAKSFFKSLLGMQAYVGMRNEYGIRSQWSSSYITMELHTRLGKYYLLEFQRGGRGFYPQVELAHDPIKNPGTDSYRRRASIPDATRITFMFGKRIDWLGLRLGIKESSPGAGADGYFFDDRLKLSGDVYDAGVLKYPRLKVAAAFELFAHLYVLAGVEDALNDPVTLEMDPLPDGIPRYFQRLSFGRDYFIGGYLQFRDVDLVALLAIGGGLMATATM